MQKEEIVEFWKASAKRDLESSDVMFESRQYHYSLFVLHLAIEKLLKAHLVKNDLEIIKIHDLSRLAKKANIELSSDQKAELDEITQFNFEARYDEYKNEFYKKATIVFTSKWREIGKKWFKRLEEML